MGKTTNLSKRLLAHLNRAKNCKQHCSNWINSLQKENLLPIMSVVEITNNESWQDREKYWIAHYRHLYDLTNFMEGGQGGASYGRLGKKNSIEHLENTRKSRLGKKIKQNDKKDLRKQGIQRYKESVAKPILQFSLEGELLKEWKSAVICAKEMNFHYQNIDKCCKGMRNKAHGFLWKYKTEEIENDGR